MIADSPEVITFEKDTGNASSGCGRQDRTRHLDYIARHMRRVDPTNLAHRCGTCGTLRATCVCEDLPRFSPPVRFLFLQHSTEIRKPTNTARLACRILDNSWCETWSRSETSPLPAEAILLYPLSGARVLSEADLVAPRTFVVPDATWAQASRIANVLASRGMPVATLPPDIQGRWGVRRGGEASRVSSAEAAALALGLAGEKEASECLLGAVSEAGRRILAMRGLAWPL